MDRYEKMVNVITKEILLFRLNSKKKKSWSAMLTGNSKIKTENGQQIKDLKIE